MATTSEIATAMKQAEADASALAITAFWEMAKIEADRDALFHALQFSIAALGEAVNWYGDEDTTFGATRRWREAIDRGRAVMERAESDDDREIWERIDRKLTTLEEQTQRLMYRYGLSPNGDG